MDDFETILNSCKTLEKMRLQSHSFYIASDVRDSQTFFPSKRIPLLAAFFTPEEFLDTFDKLVSCYGVGKNVLLVSKQQEREITLEKLHDVCIACLDKGGLWDKSKSGKGQNKTDSVRLDKSKSGQGQSKADSLRLDKSKCGELENKNNDIHSSKSKDVDCQIKAESVDIKIKSQIDCLKKSLSCDSKNKSQNYGLVKPLNCDSKCSTRNLSCENPETKTQYKINDMDTKQCDDTCFDFPCVLVFSAENLQHSKRFDFSDLIEIMIRLRAKDGCEWDKAQTHESIRINLIEEAYELVEAIDKKDSDMILEEAGDVLLQAVFHTHIKMDDKVFDYGDMLSGLCQKLLTRHTHIFGQNHADDEEQALNFWTDAKKSEKGYQSFAHSMKLVPKNLPSLLYATKIQKRAKKAGFDWNDISGAIDKIAEELSEVLSASEKNKEMEGGDLLFAVVNVLRFIKIEPEMALKAATEKFVRRFELVERELTKDGSEFEDHTLEEMNAVWDSIKLCE